MEKRSIEISFHRLKNGVGGRFATRNGSGPSTNSIFSSNHFFILNNFINFKTNWTQLSFFVGNLIEPDKEFDPNLIFDIPTQ
jgi:hypothetical protein